MLDDNDLDEVVTASLFSNGWLSLIFLLLTIVMLFVVCGNKKECEKLSCPDGSPAVLMEHKCRCVTAPVSP
jgi:hypothetical protein